MSINCYILHFSVYHFVGTKYNLSNHVYDHYQECLYATFLALEYQLLNIALQHEIPFSEQYSSVPV